MKKKIIKKRTISTCCGGESINAIIENYTVDGILDNTVEYIDRSPDTIRKIKYLYNKNGLCIGANIDNGYYVSKLECVLDEHGRCVSQIMDGVDMFKVDYENDYEKITEFYHDGTVLSKMVRSYYKGKIDRIVLNRKPTNADDEVYQHRNYSCFGMFISGADIFKDRELIYPVLPKRFLLKNVEHNYDSYGNIIISKAHLGSIHSSDYVLATISYEYWE